MRRFSAHRGLSIVVLVAAGLLAACSGTPTGSSRPSGTSTPSSTMSAADRAAIASVVAWRDGWNKSVATHSSIPFRKEFSGKCSVCDGNAETLDRIFGEGEQITGGMYVVSGLKVEYRSSAAVVVQGVLALSAIQVRSGKQVVDRIKGFTDRTSWKVVREDGRWLVANVGSAL
jgi:hypothetical protein